MAVYTMTIRSILDNVENGFPDLLHMSDYPIYSEDHREELNRKICDHYYYREIGFETVSMFYDRLLARLREVMPYYNELYRSADMEFNPLWTDDYTLTRTEEGTNTATGTSSATTEGTATDTGSGQRNTTTTTRDTDNTTTTIDDDGKNVVSDTPQAMLDRDISNPGWASGATLSETDRSEVVDGVRTGSGTGQETSSNTSTSTTEGTTESETSTSGTVSNEITERRTGRQGRSAVDLIKEYREQILNVDRMVIASLADLFMTIY